MSHLDAEQLSALIDGQLSLTHRHAALAHLEECHACAARHEALIEVAAGLRTIEPVAWTPALSAAVIDGLDTPVQADRAVLISIVVALIGCGVVLWQLPALRAIAAGAETLATVVATLVPVTPGPGIMALLSMLALLLACALLVRPRVSRR